MNGDRAARVAAKLLALAKSNNKHEAASARQEAERLIQEHSLDAEQLAASTEDVEVTADRDYDAERIAIAEVIARAEHCRTAGVKWIAFRGQRSNAEAAVRIYQTLVQRAIEDSDRAMRGAPETARAVWWSCYFTGFVPAVETRLKSMNTHEENIDFGNPSGKAWTGTVETTTPEDLKRARVDAAAQRILHAAEDLAAKLEADQIENAWDRVDVLTKRAHRAGKNAGQAVEISIDGGGAYDSSANTRSPSDTGSRATTKTESPQQQQPVAAVVGRLPARRWRPWTRKN